MTDDGVAKINNAIKACLNECYEADSPLACVGQYLDRLRLDPAFNDADIKYVREGVVRMLTMMFRRSEDGEFSPLLNESQMSDA